MKKVLISLVAALLVSLPAAAIDVVVLPPTPALPTTGTNVTGWTGACTLLTAGDFCQAQVSGSVWASVKITFAATTSPAQITVAYSIDGGVNFFNSGTGAPLLKRTDKVGSYGTGSNNVCVGVDPTGASCTFGSSYISVAAATAQAWELPLAANVTHVRAFAAVTGTNAQAVSITGLQPYVPGTVVTAVVYDTSGAGVLDTGGIDVSGWSNANIYMTNTVASLVNNFRILAVDDAGTVLGNVTTPSLWGSPLSAGAADNRAIFSNSGSPFVGALLSTTGSTFTTISLGHMPKRLEVLTLALATNRVRVQLGR